MEDRIKIIESKIQELGDYMKKIDEKVLNFLNKSNELTQIIEQPPQVQITKNMVQKPKDFEFFKTDYKKNKDIYAFLQGKTIKDKYVDGKKNHSDKFNELLKNRMN